jgi:hypothetical protein
MVADGNEIRLKGKVIAGNMIDTFRYIRDERGFGQYPEASTLGLQWNPGDELEITIRRIPCQKTSTEQTPHG